MAKIVSQGEPLSTPVFCDVCKRSIKIIENDNLICPECKGDKNNIIDLEKVVKEWTSTNS